MKNTKDKETIQQYTEKLIQMTNEFCARYLNEEYKALCDKLIRKMARKRVVPFLSGRIEIWAAAVIYALGTINFLFDKGTQPYVSAGDICDYFGTSKSTTSQKAKVIRDMFKLYYWDKEFSTEDMKKNSPYSSIAFVDGMAIPTSYLPPELQELARANPDKQLTIWTQSLDMPEEQ